MLDRSILEDILSLLDTPNADNAFKDEVMIFINSVFPILTQLGIGPSEGFQITGFKETWSDFLGDDKGLAGIRQYIFMKVKLVFDPPQSSFVLDAFNKMISEYEWRGLVEVETPSFGGKNPLE